MLRCSTTAARAGGYQRDGARARGRWCSRRRFDRSWIPVPAYYFHPAWPTRNNVDSPTKIWIRRRFAVDREFPVAQVRFWHSIALHGLQRFSGSMFRTIALLSSARLVINSSQIYSRLLIKSGLISVVFRGTHKMTGPGWCSQDGRVGGVV